MSIRNNFPGLYYIEGDWGEIKIVDSPKYYPALLNTEKSFKEAAEELGISEKEAIDAAKQTFLP